MGKKPTVGGAGSGRSAGDQLPNAELDVLACLWREGEATARRVREMLKRHRPMAHGSVVTVLIRLEGKRLVIKEKGPAGKAFVFRAARRPEATYRSLCRDLLVRVFAGDTVLMVRSLLDAQPPTAEQSAGLARLLNGHKGRVGSRRR